MATRDTYLIRDGKGRMRSVIAFSHRGAVREYLATYPSLSGESIEVKRRGPGSGDWQAFRVG